MPVPSKAWFPTTLSERANWFGAFMTAFTPVATTLGFTAPELSNLSEDNADFQSIADTQTLLDHFASSFRQYRISVTEDPVGTPLPTFPTVGWVEPPVGVPAGVFQRLIQTVERIRAHPAYTDEMGANMGIIPIKATGENLTEQPPVFKARAEPGNLIYVDFVKGKSGGISVEMQVDDDADWKPADKFSKSPGEIVVPANGAKPRAVRLRARFTDGNKAFGNYSNTVNVVTLA